MFVFTTVTVVGALFAAIIAVLLAVIGVVAVRSGQRELARTSEAGLQPVWHRQLRILFGINNIVFSLLLLCIAFLCILASMTVKYVLVGIIVVLFLCSIMLVGRCMVLALRGGYKNPGRPA
ncbi:MAG TPA: hypothetical protein VL461_04730 [Dictyobacter sp.]|nr:hypothetical protein [Dictyobacter sp.]